MSSSQHLTLAHRCALQRRQAYSNHQDVDTDLTNTSTTFGPATDGASDRDSDEPQRKRVKPNEAEDTVGSRRVDDRSAHQRQSFARAVQGEPTRSPNLKDAGSREGLRADSMARHQAHKFGSTLNGAGANRIFKQFAGDRLTRPTGATISTNTTTKPFLRSSGGPPGGDGFDDHERMPKRRKLMTQSGTGIKSDPVDLSDADDLVDATITSITRIKPTRLSSPATRSDSRVNGYTSRSFEHKELQAVDAHTRVQPPKRRRKSRDFSASSQQSSRETPVESVNGGSGGKIQREAQVVISLDDKATSLSARPTRPKRDRSPSEIPPRIDLVNGIQSGSKTKPTSDDDVQESNRVLERAMRRPPYTQGLRHLSGTQLKPPRRRIQQLEDAPIALDRPPESGPEGPLRHNFVRDSAETGERPRQRVSESMKSHLSTDQRNSEPARDSLGSVDELAGETNVPSATSRNASPAKKSAAEPQSGYGSSRPVPLRSKSPPDLKQTKLKNKRAERKTDSVELDASEGDLTGSSDANVIRVQEFYSTACVVIAGEKDIRLHYDDQHGQIEVVVDGAYQMHPEGGKIICITKAEVQRVYHSQSYAGIHLYGSTGAISNGHICIKFFDSKSKEDFWNILAAMSESIKYIQEEGTRLMSIIKKKCGEILEMNRQQSHQRAQLDDTRMMEVAERKKGRMLPLAHNADDDEHIKYDLPEPTRKSARNSMKSTSELEVRDSSAQQSKLGASQISPYFQSSDVRRSSRQSKPVKRHSPTPPPPPKRWTRENKLEHWPQSVVYPPEGARRATVDFQDLERLDEGEFLNDNVISFALRRIEENMAPEHKENVHFFNSFFYSTLISKTGKKRINYDAVKRWTKNKDLFTLPYIVVPINIDLHWFVAIICNLPRLSRKATGDEDEVNMEGDSEIQQHLKDSSDIEKEGSKQILNPAAVDRPKAESDRQRHPTTDFDKLSLSDDDKPHAVHLDSQSQEPAQNTPVFRQAASRRQTSSGSKSKKKGPPPQKKYDPDEPAIITLDSFGSTHNVEARNLKDYLNAEAEEKRGMAVDTKDLQGLTAKGIPEQTNFCDCGVYLVGYIEEFAKDPRKFVTKVLTRQLDSQSDFAAFNPSVKRAEIRDQILKLQKEQESDRKVKKSAKKGAPQEPVDKSATKAEAQPDNTKRIGGAFDGYSSPLSRPRDNGKSPSDPQHEANSQQIDVSVEGEGDLELGVARPLHQHMPRSSSQEAIESSTTLKQDVEKADDSGQQEEMLDDLNVQPAHPGQSQASPGPPDALGAILADKPLPPYELHKFKTLSEQAYASQLRNERSLIADREVSSSPPKYGMDGPGERGSEVQDSQEEQTKKPQSLWEGRKVLFTD